MAGPTSPTVVPNTDPSALFSGDFWTGFAQTPTPTPVIVTFSFPTSLPSSDDSVPGFTTDTINSFKTFSTAEKAQAINALGEWAAASQIVFVQVAPGKGDINFSNVDFGTLSSTTDGDDVAGIGYNPFGSWNSYSHSSFTTDLTYSGDVFMNTADQNQTDGTVAYATLLHEIGHAIGLKHPTQVDDDYATQVFEDHVLSADDPNVTIMSTQPNTETNPHLFPLDMAAAAAIYGAPGTGTPGTSSGPGEVVTATTGIVTGSNSVSSWSWNADTQTMTQVAASADDTIHGTSVNDVITAGSGTDYLYGLDGNNVLTGGTLSTSVDYLYGGPDSDVLNGGAGTNYLYAGTGTETLNGGAGTNTFYDGVYASFGGGGTGATTMNGRGATDNFYVGSTTTQITETNAAGDATLYSTVSYTLPTNVDTLHLYGSAANPDGAGLTGTANNDANVSMFGAAGGDTLIAGSGHDYIVGAAGNDTIEVGTGYDQLFGGGGANTFVYNSIADQNSSSYIGDFVEGTDKIDLTGIAKSVGHPLTFIGSGPFTDQAGQVESYVSGNATLVEVDTTGSGTSDFQIVLYDNAVALQAGDFNLACYCAGTRIMTDHGEVPVEDLAIGDRVLTVGGALRPIRWLGQRAYARSFLAGNRNILPVCFRAGSLDSHVPARDLWVSPNHAMLIEGQLIQAVDLVNGESILQPGTQAQVRYFHVELDSHDAILAEGAWSETFLGDDGRMMFHNAHEYYERYPNAGQPPALFCAPRLSEGHELQRVRERLARLLPARRGGRAA